MEKQLIDCIAEEVHKDEVERRFSRIPEEVAREFHKKRDDIHK